jgi:hypothetical protein
MWDDEASKFVESHIDAWMQDPDLRRYARVLKRDKKNLIAQVAVILKQKGLGVARRYNQARSFLYGQLPASASFNFEVKHFVLFKKHRTVELILESAFGVEPCAGEELESIVFPYQNEAARIISRCLFPLRDKDVATFLSLFSDIQDKSRIDQEKSMRYRSMVWFVYLIVDMINTDRERICAEGVIYFRTKLSALLEKTLRGEITGPETRPAGYGYEKGKWKDTLFAWMQGEENRPFVVGLIRQFNLKNNVEHGNRLLLAKHRECVYKQAIAIFCS